MDSIKYLREICQKSQVSDTWQDKFIYRRLSIYFTWVFLHTRINAMQASWMFFLIGFIPGILFAQTKYFLGVILLQVWYVFDCVDGEIARYRKETSFTGAYFDNFIHYIIHPYIFVCLGLGAYKQTSNLLLLVLSVVIAISTMLVSIAHDLKNSILFEARIARKTSQSMIQTASGNMLVLRLFFSFLHKLCTYPTVMNIITVIALLEMFLKNNVFVYFIFSYSVVCIVVWMFKLFVNVNTMFLD